MPTDEDNVRIIRIVMPFRLDNETDQAFVAAYDSWPDGVRGEFAKMILMDSLGLHLSQEERDRKTGEIFRRLAERGSRRRRSRPRKNTGSVIAARPTRSPSSTRLSQPVSAELGQRSSAALEQPDSPIDNETAAGAPSLNEFTSLAGGSSWSQK